MARSEPDSCVEKRFEALSVEHDSLSMSTVVVVVVGVVSIAMV